MASVADDLIDYEEEEETTTTAAPVKKAAGKKAQAAAGATGEVKKGSYVGIHSTGFRDFLLKPELQRAIADCGFEHPSEGTQLVNPPESGNQRLDMRSRVVFVAS